MAWGAAMVRMTTCPKCGRMISEGAACRRCGAVLNRLPVLLVGVAIMLAIAVVYVLAQRFL